MIHPDILDKVCWTNAAYLKGADSGSSKITALVLRFPGLGGTVSMKNDPDLHDLEWGQAGALAISPYQDPWGWMNPRVVAFTDDLIDGLRQRHHLPPSVPLLSTGGSMGGHAALLYCLKSRHPIAACMALWPVCDLVYHYTERAPDLPRTMHHAFGSYDKIERVLEENCPLHQAARMPAIPYLFVHGDKDLAVGKKQHSDRMVTALRERGLPIEYVERASLGHGSPMDFATHRRIIDFVFDQISGRK